MEPLRCVIKDATLLFLYWPENVIDLPEPAATCTHGETNKAYDLSGSSVYFLLSPSFKFESSGFIQTEKLIDSTNCCV